MVKLSTFSMNSYNLGHLFQNLIFIHITEFSVCINHWNLHILTFSHKLRKYKKSENIFAILISLSVCQGCLSWVLFGTAIWLPHDQLLCHFCRDSLTNPMFITAYFSCLTWRSLGALYNKVRSQSPAKHLVKFELGSFQFSM